MFKRKKYVSIQQAEKADTTYSHYDPDSGLVPGNFWLPEWALNYREPLAERCREHLSNCQPDEYNADLFEAEIDKMAKRLKTSLSLQYQARRRGIFDSSRAVPAKLTRARATLAQQEALRAELLEELAEVRKGKDNQIL